MEEGEGGKQEKGGIEIENGGRGNVRDLSPLIHCVKMTAPHSPCLTSVPTLTDNCRGRFLYFSVCFCFCFFLDCAWCLHYLLPLASSSLRAYFASSDYSVNSWFRCEHDAHCDVLCYYGPSQ